MNILIDIGHPAQVHNFKYVYWELEKNNHNVLFVAKDKEITKDLLQKYNLKYVILSKNQKGIIRKIVRLLIDCIKFSNIVTEFKPDILLSRMSIHSCLVSRFLKIMHIALSDTEKSINLSFFPNAILTAKSFKKNFGKKQFRFSGNIELFYLHPNRFKPDKSILDFLGVKQNEKFAIVRFVSWGAHHDVGESGLSVKQKQDLVKKLSEHAKVFISSEKKLPDEFEDNQIKIPPEKMHDAIFYSSLYVGEGGTMASEAAVMGTPSVYINSLNMGYIQEEIDSGLIFRYTDGNEAIKKSVQLIRYDNLEKFKQLSKELLNDKIDVTAFTVWFVENYPESVKIMKENPDFQYNFK